MCQHFRQRVWVNTTRTFCWHSTYMYLVNSAWGIKLIYSNILTYASHTRSKLSTTHICNRWFTSFGQVWSTHDDLHYRGICRHRSSNLKQNEWVECPFEPIRLPCGKLTRAICSLTVTAKYYIVISCQLTRYNLSSDQLNAANRWMTCWGKLYL